MMMPSRETLSSSGVSAIAWFPKPAIQSTSHGRSVCLVAFHGSATARTVPGC